MIKEINTFITVVDLPIKQIKKAYQKSKDDIEDKLDRFEFGNKITNLDDQQFIKFYPSLIFDIINFTKIDLLLFQYICEQMLMNVERYKDEDNITQFHSIDKIKLNSKYLADLFKINVKTIRNSKSRFIKYNIINKATVADYYWINPYKLFIGDRAAKYKNNTIVINNNKDREYAYELIDVKVNSHASKTE